MMSKWTDIRDGALDAMKQGALNVVEETKREVFLESNTGSPYIFGQDNLISPDHKKVAGILYTTGVLTKFQAAKMRFLNR